ncbi:MAG: MFS transporter [Candidatus Heimdallarchaeota archaeon]
MTIKKEADEEIISLVQEDPTPGRQFLSKEQRRRNIIFFAISAFFTGSANIIHFTFYNPFFLYIKDSERLIGIIATVASLCGLVGLIFADYLNDLIGYKRVLIIGLVLISASYVFFISRPTQIIWVIIAVLILSFAFSLSESPNSIMLTETAGDKQKGKILSLTNFFGLVGEITVSALIPVILSTIILFTNRERSFFYLYSSIVVMVIALVTLLFITDPTKVVKQDKWSEAFDEIGQEEEEPEEDLEISNESEEISTSRVEKQEKKGILRGFVDTFKDKWVLRVAFTFFLDATFWSIGLGVHWAGLLDTDLLGVNALDDLDISNLILATNVTVLVAMFPSGWLADKLGARALLFTSELFGLFWAGLVVVFVFFPQHLWILIVSRIALGLSIAVYIPSTISLFTNVESKRKSKVYNSIAIFRTIGWLPGGLIAGLLYDAIPQPYGYLTPMFILIAGFCLLIPAFFTLPNRPPNNNSVTS